MERETERGKAVYFYDKHERGWKPQRYVYIEYSSTPRQYQWRSADGQNFFDYRCVGGNAGSVLLPRTREPAIKWVQSLRQKIFRRYFAGLAQCHFYFFR